MMLDFEKFIKRQKNIDMVGAVFSRSENDSCYFKKGLTRQKNRYYMFCINKQQHKKAIEQSAGLAKLKKVMGKQIKQFVLIINKEKIDVVFCNGLAWYMWLLREAARQTKTPVVVIHAGIFKKEIDIYKDIFNPGTAKMLYAIEKDFVGKDVWNIFLNEFSRNVLRRDVFLKKEAHGEVVHLPLAEIYFKNEWEKPTRKKNRIVKVGAVARWDKIKNHRAILAMAEYAKKNNMPIEFYSVTKIPDSPHNKEFKQDYGNYVNVIGQMSAEKLIPFYKKIDVLVVPSHFDVSPNTVMESLILGTPALISKNVGYAEWYRKLGLKKWIVDFSNPAKAIKTILAVTNRGVPGSVRKWLLKNHAGKKAFSRYIKIMRRSVVRSKE